MKKNVAIRRILAFLICAAMIITYMPSTEYVFAGDSIEDTAVAAEETEGTEAPEEASEEEETVEDKDAVDVQDEEAAEDTVENAVAEAESGDQEEAEMEAETGSEPEAAEAEDLQAEEEAVEDPEEEDEEELEAAEDTGDFEVKAAAGSEFAYDNGVLTIKSGKVTVSMKDGTTNNYKDRIVVAGDATLVLDGITIKADKAPAIKINADAKATVTLKGENTVTGGNGYAGVEVSWESGSKYADLTINGNGMLEANGGTNSAGIGGSGSAKGVYGNITIKSGTVIATGKNNAAGIGSSGNSASGSYKGVADDKWGTITINGGNVTAVGDGSGAGIGGGNHCDSGKIIINDGNIDARGHTGIGSGYGSSQTESLTDLKKGPGYYYADIEIHGGVVRAEASQENSTNSGGAGIGGGMYSDAIILITGGDITAIGGRGKDGSYHHGAAGIGGGYEGHAEITITGGTINAQGGGAAAGIGSGAIPNKNEANSGTKGYKCRLGETTCEYTQIDISGGDITATGGRSGAAGIGGGIGADKISVSITGGNVYARGGEMNVDPDDPSTYRGGAGIGSAFNGLKTTESAKYFVATDSLNISITGGNVTAIGGWGAAGIGSGADNTTAKSITIGADASIQAYADGTKFAIDTKGEIGEDGTTQSITEGRDISGNWIQGTFVMPYEDEDEDEKVVTQETAGLKDITITNDATDESKVLTLMPEGYRSFATNVSAAGEYTVYSSECTSKDGNNLGVYFNKLTKEDKNEGEVLERNVKYTVTGDGLSDNNYLFPVKTIIISKEVIADSDIMSDIDQTLTFALWQGGDDGQWVKDGDDNWTENIELKDGVPQGNAYFSNIDDGEYGVWEIDAEDPERSLIGTSIPGNDSIIIESITTRHEDTDDNDASIGEDLWTDHVTVINTYVKTKEDADEPDDQDNQEDQIDPEDEPDDPEQANEEDEEDRPSTVDPGDESDDPEQIDDEETASIPAGNSYPGNGGGNDVNDRNAGNNRNGRNNGNNANNGTAAAAAAPAAIQGGIIPAAAQTASPDQITENIEDSAAPLASGAHADHKDCILHFILALATLIVLAVYTKRRKSLKEDIYELEEELAMYEEVE